MSNAITITKSAQKVIKSADPMQLALRAVPHADATIVKPSDIKMSDSVANTALGGKSSADAFVRSLLFKTVRLAWGACKIDQACADLPEFAMFAIKQAHSKIMGTKGITAAELRAAVVHAFEATAALPLKERQAKVTDAGKVIDVTPQPAPDESPALLKASKRAERILSMRRMQAMNEKAGILLDFQRMQERDEANRRAMENTIAFRLKAAREAIAAVDENTLRAMLAELGYELRRKPVKKAA